MALCPYVVLLVGLLWEATLSALILSCAIYLTLKTESSERRGDWMLCGAAWRLQGARQSGDADGGAVLAAVRIVAGAEGAAAATVAATMLLVVTPWYVRNRLTLHDGFLLRSNGWAEVYFSNVSNASHPTQPMWEYQALGEVEFSRLMRRRVVGYIEDHPTTFLFDSARHFLRFWIVPVYFWPYTILMRLGLWRGWWWRCDGMGSGR